jgi:predicted metal-dependent hydrolase
VPDELHMSVDDTVVLAQNYLDSGRPFHAHEVLEALWKTQPASERDLWQGLAQIAVGVTHSMRGNTVGATTLLRRGAGRVANYVGDAHGIDIAGVLSWAETLADAPGAEPPSLILRTAVAGA